MRSIYIYISTIYVYIYNIYPYYIVFLLHIYIRYILDLWKVPAGEPLPAAGSWDPSGSQFWTPGNGCYTWVEHGIIMG